MEPALCCHLPLLAPVTSPPGFPGAASCSSHPHWALCHRLLWEPTRPSCCARSPWIALDLCTCYAHLVDGPPRCPHTTWHSPATWITAVCGDVGREERASLERETPSGGDPVHAPPGLPVTEFQQAAEKGAALSAAWLSKPRLLCACPSPTWPSHRHPSLALASQLDPLAAGWHGGSGHATHCLAPWCVLWLLPMALLSLVRASCDHRDAEGPRRR